jgi:hypothetical protein
VYATAALKIKNPSLRRLADRLEAYLAHHGIARKAPEPKPAKAVAEVAVRLHSALTALQKPAEPEIQKEEASATVQQTARVVPPKRTLKPRSKGKNFAKSW